MKKQSLLLVLLLGIFAVFQSCEKKSLIDDENGVLKEEVADTDKNLQTNIDVFYYFNETLINKNPLDLKEDKNSNVKNIMIVFEPPKKGVNNRITINSFDTDEQYIAWGKKNNIPVADILDKENKLIEFVKKNNIEEIYEKTGMIPENYEKFIEELFSNNKVLAAPITIFKGLYSNEGAWVVQNTIPSLKHTTWDNEISGYVEHAVHGAVSWYDGKWYRYKMATTWNWGWNRVRFNGALSGLNDRTTSLINW